MIIANLSPAWNADAELIERIVATVNDDVILLSEFKTAVRLTEESGKAVIEEDILELMIQNRLLLEQAKKFSFGMDASAGPSTPDMVIQHYIDRRIKALIYIPFRDIETHYFINIEKYDDRDLYDVKDEIEKYLLNKKLEIKIQEHIDELKQGARIRVQLD
ncbi:MAG: hypothetical protein ISR97_03140 [Nitrospira sp.]|nr:hypothetical protein [Nitrospira sp.]